MVAEILARLARRDAYFANDPTAKAGLLGVTEILSGSPKMNVSLRPIGACKTAPRSLTAR